MISKDQPGGFNPQFEVVSCYVEHGGEMLLLHRLEHKSEGGKWGVPAGKMERGETRLNAMARELKEETGIVVVGQQLRYIGTVFVRFPDYDFVYHMFRCNFSGNRPAVRLSPKEHKAFDWVTPEGALAMNLVQDLDACIRMTHGVEVGPEGI